MHSHLIFSVLPVKVQLSQNNNIFRYSRINCLKTFIMDGTLLSFSVKQDKVQHEPWIEKDSNTINKRQQNTEIYKV
jgi:hypothetical protein